MLERRLPKRHRLTRSTCSVVGGHLENAAQAMLEGVVRIGVARGQRRQRRALRRQALFAGFERLLRRQLLADVFDHRQHGGLVVPGDHPRRRPRPERLAVRLLQVQQHIVGAPGLLERHAQAFAMRDVGVVIGGGLPDRVGVRNAEHLGVALVDRNDRVVAQPADHRRKRTDIEKLFERAGHERC